MSKKIRKIGNKVACGVVLTTTAVAIISTATTVRIVSDAADIVKDVTESTIDAIVLIKEFVENA